jgi:hypothetical protein
MVEIGGVRSIVFLFTPITRSHPETNSIFYQKFSQFLEKVHNLGITLSIDLQTVTIYQDEVGILREDSNSQSPTRNYAPAVS